jgi:hypothetical protein
MTEGSVRKASSKFGWWIVFVMVNCALAVTSFAQSPGWSRGQQVVSLSFEDCVRRAASSLQAEGYQVEYSAGAFAVGRKDVHTGVIMCNGAPDGQQWVNIVVASNGDGGGTQRQRLQAQMNGAPTTPPPPPPPPGGATAVTWYTTTKEFLNRPNGQRFSVSCPPYPGETISIWGTDVYTFDSGVCLAGVHVGVITLQHGGTVTIEMRPGQSLYPATVRNGISSQGYGQYDRSFAVVSGASNAIAPIGGSGISGDALGQVWSESEAGFNATWKRRPGTNLFDGFWAGVNVSALLEINVSGNRVTVHRSQGSDGYVCDYTGTVNGNEVSGTFGCNKNPGPIAWRATIQR